jgi:hypothetical protein
MKDEGGRMIGNPSSIRPSSFLIHPYHFGAGDEIRTRDPQLGRLMLYQLSYTRPLSNFELRNSDCGFNCALHKSEIRISKSEIPLVQGVGFEPT